MQPPVHEERRLADRCRNAPQQGWRLSPVEVSTKRPQKPPQHSVATSVFKDPGQQPDMTLVSDQKLERLGDAACVEEALLQAISRAVSSFKSRHQEYLCRKTDSRAYCPQPAVF